MTLPIREADDRDFPAMLEIWVEAWTALLPEIDFHARRSWFAQHLATLRRQGALCFVAVDTAGRIQGFVTVDPGMQDVDQLVTALSADAFSASPRTDRPPACRSP